MEGRVLNGRYRLVSRIAVGSMGQVWRCFDEALKRDVAAKLLLTVSPTPDVLARFDREARLAGALSSPWIVTVHDYGHAEYDGTTRPFLIMELLTGRTLARILESGRPPELAKALEWTVQVCDALAVAHRAGVVHRDVKPDNVMVTSDGTVKVLDFGIARFAETEATRGALTTSGTVVGTANYMSPEQAQGHQLDPRSDLYSLGCLLYALITGRPPFRGDSLAALAYQHVSMVPVAPSALRPEVSRALDRLVLDLLAKEPSQRPADAAAVRAQLVALSQTGLDRTHGEFADLLYELGVRFSQADRPDKALRPALEAVDLRRALARVNPDRYRVDLAASLDSLGLVYSDLGRREEALSPTAEAVDLYRLLAGPDPDRHRGDLAGALTNHGLVLADLGRREEALLSTVEAVDLYRSLAGSDPDRHRGDLARSLHSLALVYSDLGHRDDALPLTSEAVDLFRSLAETDPDRHLGDLAASLVNLGAGLCDLGHRDEALPPTREAVDAYRELAKAVPERFNGDLAGSLTNLAFLFSESGRPDQAVRPAQEAVDLYRASAHADSDRDRDDFARSLTNLGRQLTELGREREAEQVFEEAKRVRRGG
jgi:tetratricopeptide (TPR) repeat protein